jgi:plasmid stabilization system protein ParE
MPRGDKSKYTDKQERKADHIAESYESRGVPEKEAERRAWATVNKDSGGGKKSGSGRGHPESHASSRKGGRLAVKQPLPDLLPHARPRRRRQPPPAMRLLTPIIDPDGQDWRRIEKGRPGYSCRRRHALRADSPFGEPR